MVRMSITIFISSVILVYLIYSYKNQRLKLRFENPNIDKNVNMVFKDVPLKTDEPFVKGLLRDLAFFKGWCKPRYLNVLLIVSFNSPLYSHIPLLERAYKKIFPNILYCGPTNTDSSYLIEKKITMNGYFSYDQCFAYAMRMYPNYTGYFTMSDDVMLNVWNLKNLNRKKIWQGTQLPYRNSNFNFLSLTDIWLGWENGYGLKNCASALQIISSIKKFKKLFQNLMETKNTYSSRLMMRTLNGYPCYAEQSDIFYVPRNMADYFVELSNIFMKENVHLEIAVPTIIRLLTKDVINLRGIYMIGDSGRKLSSDNNMFDSFYNTEMHFIHPFKFHHDTQNTFGRDFFINNFTKTIKSLKKCPMNRT